MTNKERESILDIILNPSLEFLDELIRLGYDISLTFGNQTRDCRRIEYVNINKIEAFMYDSPSSHRKVAINIRNHSKKILKDFSIHYETTGVNIYTTAKLSLTFNYDEYTINSVLEEEVTDLKSLNFFKENEILNKEQVLELIPNIEINKLNKNDLLNLNNFAEIFHDSGVLKNLLESSKLKETSETLFVD